MNVIKSFELEFKEIKDLLCPFLITIDIEIVDIITIVDIIATVDIIKAVFCNEMPVVINDPLLLLILI